MKTVIPDSAYRDASTRFCTAVFTLVNDKESGKLPIPYELHGGFELGLFSDRWILRDLDDTLGHRAIYDAFQSLPEGKQRIDFTAMGSLLGIYLTAYRLKYEGE